MAALSIVAAALAPASASAAETTINVNKASMTSAKIMALVSAPTFPAQWMYMGPLAYGTTEGKTHVIYCVDLEVTMTLGHKNPAVEMTIGALDTDAIGNPINQDVARQITFLWKLGTSSNDPNVKMAAQGAIWTVSGATVWTKDPVLNALVLSLASAGTMADYTAMRFTDDSGRLQGGIGMVPEPATWAMLIAGFGMVGFAARRRRSAIPASVLA